jgi:ATP-dependent helicase/nuclease subunit A
MIERVKRLVIEKNIKINQLLVVTFTESAAQDMKQKLKNALSKVISGQTDENYSVSVIKNCEEQLAEVDTADISTMHAFCAKLI